MTEEIKGDEVAKESCVFKIFLSAEGGMRVEGPINDLGICLMFLELAKFKVYEHHQANMPKIIKPQGSIMNFMRNGKH